jgi:hypothetical protein
MVLAEEICGQPKEDNTTIGLVYRLREMGRACSDALPK